MAELFYGKDLLIVDVLRVVNVTKYSRTDQV